MVAASYTRRMMLRRTQHVQAALQLLAELEPVAYAHIVREAREILFAPGLCPPTAIACAGGPLGRRIVFRWDPLSMDVVALAATLFHEALHLATDIYGQFVTIPHQCEKCRSFAARARDWIYRQEAALEARLRRATGIRRPASPSFGDALGAVVVGAAIGVGIAAVGAALAGRA